jgi:DNA modification methylase
MKESHMENSWFLISSKLKKIKFNGDTDIRYTEEFVEMFILKYTKRGARILDPFAGFGTTLFVGQRLGRAVLGIEYDESQYEYINDRIKEPCKIIHGNSLNLGSYNLPKFDFSITSPPFMRKFDKEDPFTNYTKIGSYSKYLKDIGRIYRQIKKVMKKNATIIIEVSNTIGEGRPMTPLAWDIGREISKIFFFEQEIIYCSMEGDHSHVLVFKNK